MRRERKRERNRERERERERVNETGVIICTETLPVVCHPAILLPLCLCNLVVPTKKKKTSLSKRAECKGYIVEKSGV